MIQFNMPCEFEFPLTPTFSNKHLKLPSALNSLHHMLVFLWTTLKQFLKTQSTKPWMW